MLIDLNEDTLQDLISKNEKVVVQFSAHGVVIVA
jgi:rRNA pseudouridine-1189 N-methylase Emg1 (Nep1/Mra1 family)